MTFTRPSPPPVALAALAGLPRLGVMLVALLVAGCRQSELETAPVSGVVTLDGRPVPDLLVVFNPTRGTPENRRARPGSSGMTDQEGRFELETIDGRGAVPGEHVVSLTFPATEEDADASIPPPPPAVALPPEATDRSLTFVVPADGTEEARFALQSVREPAAEASAPAGLSERAAGSPSPSGGAAPEAARWYLATISVWFVTVSGCFCWWRFNLRQLREQA